ncbi:MAG: hypothetical protein ACR2KP_10960, partial [Egibacteraceae bacterium]
SSGSTFFSAAVSGTRLIGQMIRKVDSTVRAVGRPDANSRSQMRGFAGSPQGPVWTWPHR